MTAQTAIIDVKYVNPPKDGKQYGSIKDADNQTWPVKRDRIREFEPNNSYELAYTEGNNGFRNIIGVKRFGEQATAQAQPNGHNGVKVVPRPATQIQPKAVPPQNNAAVYYRPTAPKDARRMFLTATLGHFIETGRVDCNAQSIADAMVEILGAYAAVIGKEDLIN